MINGSTYMHLLRKQLEISILNMSCMCCSLWFESRWRRMNVETLQ